MDAWGPRWIHNTFLAVENLEHGFRFAEVCPTPLRGDLRSRAAVFGRHVRRYVCFGLGMEAWQAPQRSLEYCVRLKTPSGVLVLGRSSAGPE